MDILSSDTKFLDHSTQTRDVEFKEGTGITSCSLLYHNFFRKQE